MTPPATKLQLLFLILASMMASVSGVHAGPVISELMAAYAHTLADKDGAYPDWIELYNPDSNAVDLTGWYLTDSTENKTKWQFPAVSISAGGYLVIFASGKDRRDPHTQLHTNFNLKAGGEYLGLIKPDAVTPGFEISYPAQADDISFGLP